MAKFASRVGACGNEAVLGSVFTRITFEASDLILSCGRDLHRRIRLHIHLLVHFGQARHFLGLLLRHDCRV